jgi:fructose-1,6-bisphosphatase/inositol monophosphatase family enzyme
VSDHRLLEILLQTIRPGGIILNALRGTLENQPKMSDLPQGVADATSTAHTIGDDIVQEVALSILHDSLPDVALNAEEATPRTKMFSEEKSQLCYHIDPLDGTLSFTQGKDGYSIGASFSRNRVFVASAIYFPALDRIYLSERGSGVKVQTAMGDPIEPAHASEPADTYIHKRAEQLIPVAERMGLREFKAMGAHHGMIAIAEGRARVLLYRLASPHDFGIPQVIVEEAGGVCTDLKGEPVVYDEDFNRLPWFLAFFDMETKSLFFEAMEGA